MLPSHMYHEVSLLNSIVEESIRHGTNWNNKKVLTELLQEWIAKNDLGKYCKVSDSTTFIQIEEIQE